MYTCTRTRTQALTHARTHVHTCKHRDGLSRLVQLPREAIWQFDAQTWGSGSVATVLKAMASELKAAETIVAGENCGGVFVKECRWGAACLLVMAAESCPVQAACGGRRRWMAAIRVSLTHSSQVAYDPSGMWATCHVAHKDRGCPHTSCIRLVLSILCMPAMCTPPGAFHLRLVRSILCLPAMCTFMHQGFLFEAHGFIITAAACGRTPSSLACLRHAATLPETCSHAV